MVKNLIDLKVTIKKPNTAVLNEQFGEKLPIFQVQKRNLNFVSHEKKIWLSWKKHSPPLQSFPKVEKASISVCCEKGQYFKDVRKIFQTLNIT